MLIANPRNCYDNISLTEDAVAARDLFKDMPAPIWTERVYRKSQDFVSREVAGEYILVPIRKKLNEVSGIYVLNETGASLWRRIDGRRSVGTIMEDFCREFDVTAAKLEQDFHSLIEDLLGIQAINEARV